MDGNRENPRESDQRSVRASTIAPTLVPAPTKSLSKTHGRGPVPANRDLRRKQSDLVGELDCGCCGNCFGRKIVFSVANLIGPTPESIALAESPV
jgi:hypothetical protein